jgi:hypothetical protein
MPDYSKTVLYKIFCNDLNIIEVYVGQTTDFRKRKNRHKSVCNNETARGYNYNVYEFIRNNGGWDNWNMIEIEKYNAIDGNDAKKRERFWIEELKASLNCKIPTRLQKEYYENNKEKITIRNKNYRDNHKEEKAKTDKEYREKNKEIINEKIKEKITCECGDYITKCNIQRHKKSERHILMSIMF